MEDKRIGVHGLVKNKEGLYLLIKRSKTDPDEGDCWDLVGGGIDEGERLEDGFIREAKEEAGIEVVVLSLSFSYAADDGTLQLIVDGNYKTGEIVLSSEHNDYKWVEMNDLLNIEPASIHLKAVQYMLKNNLVIAKYEDYK